jgi:hypothetical protein
MQHAPSIVSQHEEYEQDSKADSRNYEEIDGYHCFELIFEKRAPSLRRWLATVDHILGDSCLCDTSTPSFCNSPWIRGAPQVALAAHILHIKSLIAWVVSGLPGR